MENGGEFILGGAERVTQGSRRGRRAPKTQVEVDAMNADPQTHIDEMKQDLLGGGWTEFNYFTWKAPWGALFYGPYKAWTIWAGVEMKKP